LAVRGRAAVRPVLWSTGLFALLSAWFFACAGPLGVFPIRSAWLMDQCAVPSAVACAGAALGLRCLLAMDRWELALVVENESGATDPIGRVVPTAALAGVVLTATVVAGTLALTPDRAGAVAGELVAVPRPQPHNLLPVSPPTARTDRFLSTDDPVLHDFLTQKSANPPAAHNLVALPFRDDRPATAVPQPQRPEPGYVQVRARKDPPICHFGVEPSRRYVLTVEYWTKNYRGAIHLDGETVRRTIPLPEDSGGVRVLRLFVCDASARAQVVETSVVGQQTSVEPGSGAYVGAVGLAAYRPEDLPVGVSTLLPYTAAVRVDGDEGFLVTHRRFVPGYRALVNGKRADVSRSEAGTVVVRLPTGTSEVRLQYRGTVAMQIAFAVSALTALALAGAAMRAGWQRFRLRNTPVHTADIPDRAALLSRAA
jgi:hypothetical protein